MYQRGRKSSGSDKYDPESGSGSNLYGDVLRKKSDDGDPIDEESRDLMEQLRCPPIFTIPVPGPAAAFIGTKLELRHN